MIRLRLAERADAPRLNAALAQLSAALGDTHRASVAQLAEAGWGATPLFRAQLAEEAGEVVGAAMYSPVFSTALGGPGAYVSDLWVAEAARGQGLGPRLLRAAFADAAQEWGAIFLRLVTGRDNTRARAFYARMGFEEATGDVLLLLTAERLRQGETWESTD
jgi:ribosomal protein S18 acetylase RimI-like enzyme